MNHFDFCSTNQHHHWSLVADGTISLRTALVYDGELAPGVVRSGVFDMIIPFSNLLRLN